MVPGFRQILKSYCVVNHPILERKVAGIHFNNPIGLAAGFDKNASLYNDLSVLGFGFIEVGTITPKAQPGNPKPRMFRLQRDKGLINRMGFNNGGLENALNNLSKRRVKTVLGGNIGKNKVTPNDRALDDYVILLNELYPSVDYFVVNVSSPNTPGLRELQEKEPLQKLLETVVKLRDDKTERKPVFLKIAPDLTEGQLDDIIEIVDSAGVDGIIATNTTISRDGLQTPHSTLEEIGNGGLSGDPVRERSTKVIRYISSKTNGKLPVIGVGGIRTAADAIEKFEAGASLVQVYTGFIYEGPLMIRRINKELIRYFESKAKAVS